MKESFKTLLQLLRYIFRAIIALASWAIVLSILYRGTCFIIKDIRTRTRPEEVTSKEDTAPYFNYSKNTYTIYYYCSNGESYTYEDCKDITVYENGSVGFTSLGRKEYLSDSFEILGETEGEALNLETDESAVY